MAKITITRKELPDPHAAIDEIVGETINSEKLARLAKFFVEYEVINDDLSKSVVYSIPREMTDGIGDPSIYPVIKQSCFFERDEQSKMLSASRQYIGWKEATYGLTLESAEAKAYKLARDTANYFASRLPADNPVEIDDQTGLKDSKLEATLKEEEGKGHPSAMWEEQPGA